MYRNLAIVLDFFEKKVNENLPFFYSDKIVEFARKTVQNFAPSKKKKATLVGCFYYHTSLPWQLQH
jgi:hypothetical protein